MMYKKFVHVINLVKRLNFYWKHSMVNIYESQRKIICEPV